MRQHGQSDPLAAPQLGACASSGRAWRLRAARHSQEEADPLGSQPLPRVLELATSKAVDTAPFDHPGLAGASLGPRAKLAFMASNLPYAATALRIWWAGQRAEIPARSRTVLTS